MDNEIKTRNRGIPARYEIKGILEDELECIKYLQELEIIYKRLNCPKCRKPMKIRDNKLYYCNNRNCRMSQSIFTNSWFENARLPVNKVLEIYYLWLLKVPMTSIMIYTGNASNTITNHVNNIRDLIGSQIQLHKQKIGGQGIIVEIDETKIGRNKYHRGKPVQGVWVMGAVERTDQRRIFVTEIPDKKENTLLQIIKDNIEEGSIIYSDCFRSYVNITSKLNFEHMTVNHSEYFLDPETGVHTNTIEGNWQGIKIGIPNRNRIEGKVQSYLWEYIWRRQNNDQWEAMIEAMKNQLLIEDLEEINMDNPKDKLQKEVMES